MAYSADEKFKAIKVGRRYQQNNYELLPDWFQYDFHDYELIRHKIGYAIFGIPNINKDTSEGLPSTSKCVLGNNQQDNVFNKVVYSKEMCNIIDTIYNKILEYGKDRSRDSIRFGIIYNVIALHESVKKSEGSSKNSKNESDNIFMVPVFKLRKQQCGIWYIDNDGRIYTSWKDYVTNNTLPKCTMILPKCGLYQYDPRHKVSEYNSTVWLEVLDSPACSTASKFLKGMDITASTTSICAAVGVGVASFLTPVGPIALTAALVSGASGSWIFARNSHKLVDLAAHKQSISPINKNAFPAWLGIGSTVLGIGASGGSILMTKTIAKGTAISTTAKIAYNSVIIGNLTVNGIGTVYHGYCLIEKYKTNEEVDLLDIVTFGTSVLFFSNTVINTKLAGHLIRTSNGTIYERFKSALRFNRLRKEFNRMVTNTDAQNENIVYKTKQIINSAGFLDVLNTMKDNFSMNYQDGNIVINNRIFIDPVVFVGSLLTGTIVRLGVMEYMKTSNPSEENNIMDKLKLLLTQLLRDFLCSSGSTQVSMPNVSNFYEILDEMKYSENALNLLIKVFKIAEMTLKYCNDPREFVFDAVYFIWTYCKANLRKYGVTAIVKSERKNIFHILKRIVEFLFECIDEIHIELFSAFHSYLYYKKGICYSN